MKARVLCLLLPRLRVVVERERRPELAGAPLLVYRPGARPVVLEACEEAEAEGVAPGMVLTRALSLCPRAQALPADEVAYEQVSRTLLEPLLELTPEVEPGGLGLAFMSLRGLRGREEEIAHRVKTPSYPPSPLPSPARCSEAHRFRGGGKGEKGSSWGESARAAALADSPHTPLGGSTGTHTPLGGSTGTHTPLGGSTGTHTPLGGSGAGAHTPVGERGQALRPAPTDMRESLSTFLRPLSSSASVSLCLCGNPALRVGVAGSRFAAEMAARYGQEEVAIVPAGRERQALAKLPLSVLPAPDARWREMLRRLRLLGFSQLGELAGLGRDAMQAQFGEAGLAAWKLAAGEPEPLRTLPIAVELEARRQFEEPLSSWPEVEAMLAELAEDLSRQLRRQGYACAGLWLCWQARSERAQRQALPLKEPAASAGLILAGARRCLLRWANEGLGEDVEEGEAAPHGPIEELALQARALAPERGKQMTLFERRQRNGDLERLAAELQQRLGRGAILKVQALAPSHLVERTYTFAPLS